MKKLLIVLILVLSFTIAIAPAAFAVELDLVEDFADVLTREESGTLLSRAEEISERFRCDVAIVIINEMIDDDGAYEWARFIYEEYDYGYGQQKSGVLLFLSMAERDYALIAYGFGNTAFTDYGKDVMLDRHILPLLRENKYYEAFSVYLDKAEEFLAMARSGTPFDRHTDPDAPGVPILVKLAIIILLPALIAFIICSTWKKQMKTAVKAKFASNYIPPGGFKLTGQADTFLYRTQTRTKVETKSSSSRGTTVDSRGFSGRSGKF